VLYDLARAGDWWERRLAIFATLHFVRRGEVDDTFAIAEILINDPEDYVTRRSAGSASPSPCPGLLPGPCAPPPPAVNRHAKSKDQKQDHQAVRQEVEKPQPGSEPGRVRCPPDTQGRDEQPCVRSRTVGFNRNAA